ncbi:MAG: hypothetical protein QM802_03370 [Agriterribacter sp.]
MKSAINTADSVSTIDTTNIPKSNIGTEKNEANPAEEKTERKKMINTKRKRRK